MFTNQRRRMALLLGLTLLLFTLAACRGNLPAAGTETDSELPAAPAQTAVVEEAQPSAPVNLTQSAEAGAVTIQVTPLNLHELPAATLDFQIVMDTHSVDLDVALAQMAFLRVDELEIAANAWQAPAGGHHVEGTLSFPAVDDSGRRWLDGATAVTLVIRDLADVTERPFTWDMASIARAGAMPMGEPGMAGQDMMGQMGMMQGMMGEMGDMPMAQHQEMMGQMMGMMQGMMAQMDGMPMAEHHEMMVQMMGIMQSMMPMMDDLPLEQRQEMMSQMMGMMQGMMGMRPADMGEMDHGMSGTDIAPMSTMPGMDHGPDDHMAPIPSAGVPEATETIGGQPLAFREEDGVKVFELVAAPVRWTILDDDGEQVVVTAWAYNGTVPGPMIRVTEGETVRIILRNDLPEPTSIHWHGIPLPNAMDGVPPLTQAAVEPGDSFTYEFVAPPAGSFMYHSHVETDKQIMVGLYAPFIVDPAIAEIDPPDVDVMWMLSEWRVGPDGETYAAMPMAGAEPNYFTINGKAFPNTEPIVVKMGERVRIRLANIGQFTHPMHLHGINFRIIAYDGVPLPPEQQLVRNTVPVNPGELIDIEFIADNPGVWVFHCHVLHHVTNDNVEPGGLIGVIQVEE
jgi:manganese oxidase